jgi:hypothetical protein
MGSRTNPTIDMHLSTGPSQGGVKPHNIFGDDGKGDPILNFVYQVQFPVWLVSQGGPWTTASANFVIVVSNVHLPSLDMPSHSALDIMKQ